MKKILCALISAMLILSLFAGCSSKETGNVSSLVASQESGQFEKPESYASVVLVTINPQFRLYLDAEGVVLAVEPINADAKTINKEIEFKNQKVETVVQNLVVAANNGGFIKDDATVDIKVASVKNDSAAADIADKVKLSVTAKLGEMKIEASVSATVSKDILPTDQTSSDVTSSEDTPSNATSSNETSSAGSSSHVNSENTSSNKTETPACKHTKTKAVAVSTGKNIIDSSKLDVVNHNVVCADCSAVIKTENHKVENSKCTLCLQNNFEIKAVDYVDAGPTLEGEAMLNADGSVAYDIMVGASWRSAAKSEYAIDEWHYKIPEAAMLEAIRTKFVITDAQFEALKAQGSYNFFIDTHTYSDGHFNIIDPAAGGPGSFTHTVVGYKDDKAGNFTLYVDYQDGGPEDEKIEHLYYYSIEFKYSGYSNLSVVKGEYYEQISGFVPVVDSMRIKAMKKLSALPSDITKVQ